MASADLLLHPVRLRIVRAFLGGRTLTTGQLAAELADVPPGSLYRHVALLVDAGVLAVVGQRRVRGAVERSYALRLNAAQVGPTELAAMTVEDHRQMFLAFVAGLLGDFDRYLARDDVDPARDEVGYGLTALWLDDTELAELRDEVRRLVERRRANPPAPHRRRRVVGTVVFPDDAPTDPTDDDGDAAR